MRRLLAIMFGWWIDREEERDTQKCQEEVRENLQVYGSIWGSKRAPMLPGIFHRKGDPNCPCELCQGPAEDARLAWIESKRGKA